MNILTFYPHRIYTDSLCSYGITQVRRISAETISRYRLDNRCSRGVSRGTKSGAVILEDHTLLLPGHLPSPVSLPLLLSARSLKITKIDCRQGSAGLIIEFPIPIYLCRAAIGPPTKKERGGERERNGERYRLSQRSCDASLRNYSLRTQTETSFLRPRIHRRKTEVRAVLHVKIAKTRKTYHHLRLWPHANFFLRHLMENSSDRDRLKRRVYFSLHRPGGKSPVVRRDRPSFKGVARREKETAPEAE